MLMIKALELSKIAGVTGGYLSGEDVFISSVSTDSRSIESGQLFVALCGGHFDGHDYLETLSAQGVKAAVVAQQWFDLHRSIEFSLSLIVVDDTLKAYGQIAAINRQQFGCPVIGLTGSAGKTTTKEMLASILAVQHRPLATKGNFNNEIGVPQTLLDVGAEHDYAVIEMGASKKGDIAYLMDFVCPDVALITNAAAVHTEGFGSLQGVAEGKGEIYVHLPASATALINLDDPFSSYWQALAAPRRVVLFSLEDSRGEVYASEIQLFETGSQFSLHLADLSYAVSLAVPGRYNIANAVAAATAAHVCGIGADDIVKGLADHRAVAGRMQIKSFDKITVLDDSYNANPKAVCSAIDVLAGFTEAKKMAVLGGMGELGEDSDRLHQEVQDYAIANGIDRCYVFSSLWPRINAGVQDSSGVIEQFDDKSTLISRLLADIDQAQDRRVAVLVKGSRSMAMEDVVSALSARDVARGLVQSQNSNGSVG
jgi:UDP-N-acetylmuramoyl-tripeptide--D-alanyl-D-alanine ligase